MDGNPVVSAALPRQSALLPPTDHRVHSTFERISLSMRPLYPIVTNRN